MGEIHQDSIYISEIGLIAKQEWVKSIEIRPDMNLSLSDFVFMPNHFHAILFIGENEYNSKQDVSCGDVVFRRGAINRTSTTKNNITNHFGPQSKKIGLHHQWLQISSYCTLPLTRTC